LPRSESIGHRDQHTPDPADVVIEITRQGFPTSIQRP
jgi:hypothetical protein